MTAGVNVWVKVLLWVFCFSCLCLFIPFITYPSSIMADMAEVEALRDDLLQLRVELRRQSEVLTAKSHLLDAFSEMVHGGARKSYVHDVVCERCSGQGHRSGVCPYVVYERCSGRGHASDVYPSGRRFRSGRRSRFVSGQGRRNANVSLNGHPTSE
jgi:hypothetical protein